MSHPVIHFEIIGTDAAHTQDFYRSLFGWTIDADNPMNYGLIQPNGDGGIGGGIGASPDGPTVMFYVQADDLQAVLDKAESLGGKTVMGVTEIPGMVTIASFQDVDGNVIGLVRNAA